VVETGLYSHSATAVSKRAAKLVAVGTTPEQHLRHLALVAIMGQTSNEYQFASDIRKAAKRVGADLTALLEAKNSGENSGDAVEEGDEQ
jgi:hypothetical protein